MEIVSELTNYTSIVLGNSSKENKISKVEVIPISDENLVAIVVTDKGHVESKNMNIKEHITTTEIKQTVDLINKFIIGTPIDEVSLKLEVDVKPKIADSIKQQRALYDALYNVFAEFKDESDVKIKKTNNILNQPEFNNVDKMREILNKFEDKEYINKIKEDENGVNVYIGTENEFDDEVAIIKTRYMVDGEEGTIALIGPKRMEYDRVTTLLNFIKDNLNQDR